PIDESMGDAVLSINIASQAGADSLKTSITDPAIDESYSLRIDESTIQLEAQSVAGAFYGIQTLRQLARIQPGSLPCLEIDDRPSLSFRGLMDDISRGPIPTMDYFRQQID